MSKISFLDDNAKSGEFSKTVDTVDDEDALFQQQSTIILEELGKNPNIYAGSNYELAAKYYRDPAGRDRSYYFTSQLGSPFPSYHNNPEPFFPPRWTSIRGVNIPVENITAPRIRLGPKELEQRHAMLKVLQSEARRQNVDERPKPKVLNLSHQVLGDPYQFESLKLMIALNDTVEVLNLNDNELDDIAQLDLKNVKKLYLDQNSITSFLLLPPLPNCVELVITNNFITGYSGLTQDRFPSLRKISVHGNPLCTKLKHREEIIKLLPNLLCVDWFPKGRILQAKNVSAKDVHKGHDDECC